MGVSATRDAVASWRDMLRTQMWPLPTVAIGLAVTAGIALPRLDAHADADLPGWVGGYVFSGDASAARTDLGVIASSLITVTSLTFSLTVVTLQLASSQFSPRLLRTFTRDRFVHVTLALFLATFTYALMVLRTLQNGTGTQAEVVPEISVTVAFLLTLASVISLILFLAHLVKEIRVESMLRRVHADASDAIDRLTDACADEAPMPQPAIGGFALRAPSSGFLVRIDEKELLAAAVDIGAVIQIDRYPGSSLVASTPIGRAWPHALADLTADRRDRLEKAVAECVHTAFERTTEQDIGLAMRQLTDVATKALSPSVNDPTTAIHALGHSSALLCQAARRTLGARVLRDEDGSVRVILCRPSLADLLDLAVSQPRRYGAAEPDVLARIYALLREVAWCSPSHDGRRAVAGQLARLNATVVAQNFDPAERAALAALGAEVSAETPDEWDAAKT